MCYVNIWIYTFLLINCDTVRSIEKTNLLKKKKNVSLLLFVIIYTVLNLRNIVFVNAKNNQENDNV